MLGWILFSVLSLVALYNLAFADKKRSVSSAAVSQCMTSKSTVNAECRSTDGNGGVDVIIVGAGVAGAALAHTLGKVISLALSYSIVEFFLFHLRLKSCHLEHCAHMFNASQIDINLLAILSGILKLFTVVRKENCVIR